MRMLRQIVCQGGGIIHQGLHTGRQKQLEAGVQRTLEVVAYKRLLGAEELWLSLLQGEKMFYRHVHLFTGFCSMVMNFIEFLFNIP